MSEYQKYQLQWMIDHTDAHKRLPQVVLSNPVADTPNGVSPGITLHQLG